MTNKKEQIDFLDLVDDGDVLKLSSSIIEDDITKEVSKVFDYEFKGSVTEEIHIPNFPKEFQIGLIVGSSGSGKSTILHNAFGEEKVVDWDRNKAIASHFSSYQEATEKFGAVGLNSIPTWLKPYNVLSNGEKFRANMARSLEDDAVIDEFTSVVNREVAISCSCSISKYIRKKGLKRIVFCSCHDDIIPYLSPDWVYNTDTTQFFNGRYLCRPKIDVEIVSCTKQAWGMFKKYHYLSGELNEAANCYGAILDDTMVGFVAVLPFPRGGLQHGFREHRLVVHPDYQGMGIGNKLSEAIADVYVKMGCRYFVKTSNPRIGDHRDKSSLWRKTCKNHKAREDYIGKDGKVKGNANKRMSDEKMMFHAHRVCYSHEYIGDGRTYPFTYQTQQSIQEKKVIGQMTFDDLLGGI